MKTTKEMTMTTNETHAPKERPILFSGPMVRAILNGTKSQTRRVIKPQPDDYIDRLHGNRFRQRAPYILAHPETGEGDYGFGFSDENRQWKCPYGKPGDRLWVRETWSHTGVAVWTIDDARRASGNGKVIYKATDEQPCHGCWWPSIHMPREFSRITLEIGAVRVERLNEISEADAIAEGIITFDERYFHHSASAAQESRFMQATMAYRDLWEVINGPDSWDVNPWVWVVEFKRVEGAR